MDGPQKTTLWEAFFLKDIKHSWVNQSRTRSLVTRFRVRVQLQKLAGSKNPQKSFVDSPRTRVCKLMVFPGKFFAIKICIFHWLKEILSNDSIRSASFTTLFSDIFFTDAFSTKNQCRHSIAGNYSEVYAKRVVRKERKKSRWRIKSPLKEGSSVFHIFQCSEGVVIRLIPHSIGIHTTVRCCFSFLNVARLIKTEEVNE